LEIICKATTGFVYYVSREGVTGEQAAMSDGIQANVEMIKRHTDLPVVVGFGISNAEHVHTVAQAADGVVVGSAIVNCIAENVGDSNAIEAALTAKMAALTADEALSKV
jgi:tryptophan synthase alpha chain